MPKFIPRVRAAREIYQERRSDNSHLHLGLEDAAEELRRMEEAEAARREQEKLAGKAEDAQKLFKAV